jgi:type II secretory pathway pseudopilin PulG
VYFFLGTGEIVGHFALSAISILEIDNDIRTHDTIISNVLYYLFFESLFQRTPGKFVTGTKVIMQDGTTPDFMHILGRSAARYIPFEALSFLFNDHPVGWHDYLSGTMVVPNAYTPAEVAQIDLSNQTKRSSGRIILIIALILLFVFAIVGVLAAIVLSSLTVARTKGLEITRVANVHEYQVALELHRVHSGMYPQSLSELSSNEMPYNPIDPSNKTFSYYSCPDNSYHLGATLDDLSDASLTKDADSDSLCPGDTVHGADTTACDGIGKGACYDVVGRAPVATQYQTINPSGE